MSSTTPWATRNSASLDKLQVEKASRDRRGRDKSDLLYLLALGQREGGRTAPGISRVSESKPSALKLLITSRTRSGW